MKQSPFCLRFQSTTLLLSSLPRLKWKKQLGECQLAKLQVLNLSQQKYMQLVAHYSLGSSLRYTRPCGIRRKSHRNSEMLILLTSTNEKERGGLLITTVISLLSIAGKILTWILLNHLNQHLKQDLLPERQHGIFCKAVIEVQRTECLPLHHLCRPDQGL